MLLAFIFVIAKHKTYRMLPLLFFYPSFPSSLFMVMECSVSLSLATIRSLDSFCSRIDFVSLFFPLFYIVYIEFHAIELSSIDVQKKNMIKLRKNVVVTFPLFRVIFFLSRSFANIAYRVFCRPHFAYSFRPITQVQVVGTRKMQKKCYVHSEFY